MKEVMLLAIGFGIGYGIKKMSAERERLNRENEALRAHFKDEVKAASATTV